MDQALRAFRVDVCGVHALDVGASTGGFTDCLLQRGAASVLAVDVGHGQLHPALRADARVRCWEGLHVRDLHARLEGERFSLAVVDCSFVSVVKVAQWLTPCLLPDALLVVLLKPQFEAGPERVGKGVVREPLRTAVVHEALHGLRSLGLQVLAHVPSETPGPKGNVEELVALRWSASAEPGAL